MYVHLAKIINKWQINYQLRNFETNLRQMIQALVVLYYQKHRWKNQFQALINRHFWKKEKYPLKYTRSMKDGSVVFLGKISKGL
ncbi:hypothetical protein BpHYR1_017934 [Brachionus plicatilis]|uniref:Uncharacterized protein n=1 Tax=Brachionus plicatilis TaxID=10195 RepID=A0A3M7PV91_BRAPC|nr:hypothetical protein BpHYR1_017934 [Brachionus plicatilis]